MKNPYALILLVAATTAYGQINNPPTSVNIVDSTATGRAVLTATNSAAAATAIGLGTANEVTFNRVQVGGASFSADDFSGGNFVVTGGHALTFSSGGTSGATLTNLGLGATNNVEFRRLKMIAADAYDDADNATLWLDTSGTNKAAAMRLSGTGGSAEKYNAYLQATSFGLQVSAGGGFRVLSGPTAGVGSVLFAVNSSGNATLNGTANLAPSQTADSGSSLMTRDLGDVRYAPRTMDAFVVDEFVGGGNGAQFVGQLGWYAYDGAGWAYGAFSADFPATWRLQNSSITNGRAALESAGFGSRGRDWTWQWTFKLNKITQARWAFGNFPNDISARNEASGHFGVYYDSANSSNWHVYVSDGSTNTVTDTGIAATTDYAAIKMSYVGTNLTVAIANSSLVFGSPVAIPSTALGSGLALTIPAVYINNLDGNAQSVDLDRMWIYGRFPNRD